MNSLQDTTKRLGPSSREKDNTTSLLKKEATPGDVYYVAMPSLSPNQVILDTMNLTFRFKNNLGRLLCEGRNVQIGGEIVCDNTGESIMEVYKDLWKSDAKREYGVANENTRKLLSKDDSAVTADKEDDVLMVKNQKILKIKLGKILEGHGPYAPYEYERP